MIQNCINCGARLEPLAQEHIRCGYCGTVFEKPDKENESKSTPQNTGNADAPTQQDSGNSGCGVLFLVSIVVLVIAVYVHKEQNGNNIVLVDSVITDTSELYPNTDDLYTYDIAKKISIKNDSEKAVLVSGKIYHQAYASVLNVTFKHNALKDERIDKIKFAFKLFDKAGKELVTGDSNEREVSTWLYKGHSNTEEWWLAKRLPKAKSVKFYVKEVEFEKEIWKYE